jgi:hypothetical protein
MDQSTQELIAMIGTAVIGGVIVVGTLILLLYAETAQQREITVADIIDDCIEDTDGNVWHIRFYNPFDQRDLTIGSTIRIRCGLFVPDTSVNTNAVFDGWVHRPSPATE